MLSIIADPVRDQLSRFLAPEITDLTLASLGPRTYAMVEPGSPVAQALGIEVVDGAPTILVTDPTRRLGSLRLLSAGHGNVLAIDNAAWTGTLDASMRILGSDSLVLMEDILDGFVRLNEVLLRSHHQLLFWGRGASAVGISIEIEGDARACVIGDDALISNDVWIRNHDMHAMHDLASGAMINRPPCDTVLERHVWLGQDALLLNCHRVGMGSIVGARALAKGHIPALSVAAGQPARVLRSGTSWGRSGNGMTQEERASLGLPPLQT